MTHRFDSAFCQECRTAPIEDFRPAPKPQPREKKPPKLPRAKNAKRALDGFTRCYHSEERVQFVQELWCVVGGSTCKQPSENAHTEGGGTGRKAGYETIVPLCRIHHRQLHSIGREEFEGTHLVDLAALALDTERCWRRYANT